MTHDQLVDVITPVIDTYLMDPDRDDIDSDVLADNIAAAPTRAHLAT